METLKLRTATFGGFQRQDVVDYIESTAREHAAQLNALRAELKQAQEKADALEGEKARADALSQRCEDLAARVDELAPLEDEVKKLRAQVEEFRPQAEAYADVKSKLADIELEAHARSAQVVKQAEEEAAGKRLEAQAMLDEIMQEYSHVGSTANTAITDVICKLTDLRASLSRLGELEQKLGGRSHE